MIDALPHDLSAVVAAHLARPNAFLRCCKNAAAIGQDEAAVSAWLQRQHGNQSLLAFMKCACSSRWPISKIRKTCALLLDGTRLRMDDQGCSILLRWAAAQLGDGPLLEMLMSGLPEGHSPALASGLSGLLHEACTHGNLSVVRVLLKWKAMPKGCLTLKAAVERGHVDVVCALLASGLIDPRADSDCALRTAAKYGQTACAALLLAAGCCPHARQGEALCLSVGGGHTEVVRLLLQHGADASARPGLLHLAVGAADGNEALVAMLIEAGAVDQGDAALSHASTSGKQAVVRLLLVSKRMRSAVFEPRDLALSLQQALSNGHYGIAKNLLEAGAQIDSMLLSLRHTFPDKEAALKLLEAFPGHVRCGQAVLDDSLSSASMEADPSYLSLLLQWGADPLSHECAALRKAVLHGRAGSVRALIAAAGVAGLRREMPCCVLRASVARGHLEVVEALLSEGLWPSAGAHHCCSDPRTCPARVLCGASSRAMAGLLMEYGAGVHAGDALRLVACGKAPSWRSEEVVQVMMDAMVDSLSAGVYAARTSQPGRHAAAHCCWHEESEEAEGEEYQALIGELALPAGRPAAAAAPRIHVLQEPGGAAPAMPLSSLRVSVA